MYSNIWIAIQILKGCRYPKWLCDGCVLVTCGRLVVDEKERILLKYSGRKKKKSIGS